MKGEIWMVELGAGGNDRKKFGNHFSRSLSCSYKSHDHSTPVRKRSSL